MQFLGGLDEAVLWRAVPVLLLGWLAIFFGRTLRAGHVPLIEQVARVRDPALTPALCRYTRRLTAIWSAYFAAAALLSTVVKLPFWWAGGLVWLGVIGLFVGEHRLRSRLFPGHSFPSLTQQLHDTVSIWRGTS